MSPPILSVIICTYNRAEILEGAIESLIHQITPDCNEYEIIVVDNNSNDSTKGVVEQFAGVKYLFDPVQGLSHARNTGWQNARGEYVAYMDDDAYAPPEYVSNLIVHLKNHHPHATGGPIYPFYPDGKPTWFKDAWETRTWGDEPRWAKPSETFRGSNMAYKRSIFKEIGGFDPTLGMNGGGQRFSEETQFYLRIWRHYHGKARIFYHPDACIYHAVPREKTQPRFIINRRVEIGFDYIKATGGGTRAMIGAAVMFVLWGAWSALKYPFCSNRNAWLTEYVGHLGFIFGVFVGGVLEDE